MWSLHHVWGEQIWLLHWQWTLRHDSSMVILCHKMGIFHIYCKLQNQSFFTQNKPIYFVPSSNITLFHCLFPTDLFTCFLAALWPNGCDVMKERERARCTAESTVRRREQALLNDSNCECLTMKIQSPNCVSYNKQPWMDVICEVRISWIHLHLEWGRVWPYKLHATVIKMKKIILAKLGQTILVTDCSWV